MTTRPTTAKRVALYTRASTAKKLTTPDGDEYCQRPEIQESRLRRLCEQRGWQVVGVYTDRASGRKEQRPELQRLMADARRGEIQVVAVAAFDRFARSVRHLMAALDEFRHLGIEFVSLRESIDTSTALGNAMFTIIGAMAELESSLISERTCAAMEYTRTHGSRSGRPAGRQRRVFRRDEAVELRAAGASYRSIATRLGVPLATVYDAVRQFEAQRSEKGTDGGGGGNEKHEPDSPARSVRQGSVFRTPEASNNTTPEAS
jgi:DNA invertase Pin-like site-specific DNA recombinase